MFRFGFERPAAFPPRLQNNTGLMHVIDTESLSVT